MKPNLQTSPESELNKIKTFVEEPQSSMPEAKSEIGDNSLFPAPSSKKSPRCSLCYQKIPSSWAPSKQWSSWYKRMTKLISTSKDLPKKKYKLLPPPSSDSSDTESDNREKKSDHRTISGVKSQQYFLNDISDDSLQSP